VGPLADSVLTGKDATWNEHLLLPMLRNGFLEETYFTFSYSPVPDDSGRIGGMLITCQETTGEVQDGRRSACSGTWPAGIRAWPPLQSGRMPRQPRSCHWMGMRHPLGRSRKRRERDGTWGWPWF
jgi:hypothetical protein